MLIWISGFTASLFFGFLVFFVLFFFSYSGKLFFITSLELGSFA